MLFLGDMNHLKVLRKTDIGYMLTDGNEEVFLHFNECTRELSNNEELDFFLYYDKKHRITATMSVPTITVEKAGFVPVISITPNLGAFVSIGTSKDLLLSKDNFDVPFNCMPQVGDKFLCVIKEKKDTLEAKLVKRVDLKKYFPKEEKFEIHDMVQGYVSYIGENGVNLFTENGTNIFIYRKNLRELPRLGELVTAEIININPYGDYNATLNKRKELMIDSDSEIIYQYIIDYDGQMPLDSDSTPEEIFDKFHMSKKAFKRALGHLYKEHKVYFKDGKTYLNKENK